MSKTLDQYPNAMPKPKKKPKAANAIMPIRPMTAEKKARLAARRKQKATEIEARRARIAAACDRTRRARAELDARAKGADLSDVAHLPVMEVVGPPRFRGAWRNPSTMREPVEAEPAESPAQRPANGDIYLPRASGKKCHRCGEPAHFGMGCEDLRLWLKTAKAVLSSAAPGTP